MSAKPDFYRIGPKEGLPTLGDLIAMARKLTGLALGMGTAVHEVAARVGHAKATMTSDLYAHSQSDRQDTLATALDAVLGGRG